MDFCKTWYNSDSQQNTSGAYYYPHRQCRSLRCRLEQFCAQQGAKTCVATYKSSKKQ